MKPETGRLSGQLKVQQELECRYRMTLQKLAQEDDKEPLRPGIYQLSNYAAQREAVATYVLCGCFWKSDSKINNLVRAA